MVQEILYALLFLLTQKKTAWLIKNKWTVITKITTKNYK